MRSVAVSNFGWPNVLQSHFQRAMSPVFRQCPMSIFRGYRAQELLLVIGPMNRVFPTPDTGPFFTSNTDIQPKNNAARHRQADFRVDARHSSPPSWVLVMCKVSKICDREKSGLVNIGALYQQHSSYMPQTAQTISTCATIPYFPCSLHAWCLPASPSWLLPDCCAT